MSRHNKIVNRVEKLHKKDKKALIQIILNNDRHLNKAKSDLKYIKNQHDEEVRKNIQLIYKRRIADYNEQRIKKVVKRYKIVIFALTFMMMLSLILS